MASVQFLSIVLEAVIALLFLSAGLKGRTYLLGLALAFSIYVLYDLAKLYAWVVPDPILPWAFFIATLAALWSAWGICKR